MKDEGFGALSCDGLKVPRARADAGRRRERHREQRSVSLARALGGNRSAVQLDNVPGERKPKPETAELARRASVRLPESVKDERQIVPRDANPSVAEGDPDLAAAALALNGHAAARGCELDRVREDVPHHLMQAVAIAQRGQSG